MLLAATDWSGIVAAIVAGVPGIIAAVYAGRVHRQVTTPSGKTLGEVAEYAHDTAIANNLLLSRANGATTEADPETIKAEGETPPQIPSNLKGS